MLVTNSSVSCHNCNNLAAPLIGSGNVNHKYRCVNCGKQFEGTTHNIEKALIRLFGDEYKTKNQFVHDKTFDVARAMHEKAIVTMKVDVV